MTSENTKKEHESFMIKEILEQPKMLSRILQNFDFDKVKNSITTDQVSLVYIVACGSSFLTLVVSWLILLCQSHDMCWLRFSIVYLSNVGFSYLLKIGEELFFLKLFSKANVFLPVK